MSGASNEPLLAEWRTTLVGRDADIAALTELVTAPNTSLVTVTGPGGIGKTRLALRVADEARPTFPGGVSVASLGAIRDPALVLQTIIQSFDLKLGGDVNDLSRLAMALGEERHLLLVDSFEHLTGEAPLITMLLAACPNVTVLVTSRAALRLSMEREYPLGPLTLSSRLTGLTAGEAGRSAAIELFVQRARAVKPDFALTEDNAETIAEIVARLDGLPLAIELAAVRSKVLAPRALLARLSHRLSILTGGARDMPERLRTMRDAIAWSHGLLDKEEQTLFRRLAVFNGSFSLDAAEAVAGGEGIEPGAVERSAAITPLPFVLDGIASLVDKSLLVHEFFGEGESRYRMLQTIREFAQDQLVTNGEEAATQERLVTWATNLASEARIHLYGSSEQITWLHRLSTERDSIRGALAWSFAHEEIGRSARLAGLLWGYWFSTDNVREGVTWLDQAVARADELTGITRLQVHCGVGFLALVRLEFEKGARNLEMLRKLAEEAQDYTYIGWSEFGLGVIAQDTSNPQLAEERFEAARSAFKNVPDRPALYATASQNLGLVYSRQGRHEQAVQLIQEALATFRQLNFELGIVLSSRFLGQVMRAMGDQDGAIPLLLDSLRVNRTITQQWHIANALEALASIAAGRHQEALATRIFGSIDLFRTQASAPLEPSLQPEHDQIIAKLRKTLGEERFAEEWSIGRLMAIEQTIEAAAEVGGSGSTSLQVNSKAEDIGLTPREIEVLRVLVDGKSTNEIAEMLFISPRTVSTHIASILGKLGVPTRSAAVAMVMRSDLLS